MSRTITPRLASPGRTQTALPPLSPNARNRRLLATTSPGVRSAPKFSTKSLVQVVKQQEATIYSDSSRSRQAQTSAEEKKELYLQLQILRKKHDVQKRVSEGFRKEFEATNAEAQRIETFTNEINTEVSSLDSRLEKTQSRLESIKSQIEKELENKKTYEHIKARLIQQQIANEKTSNAMENEQHFTKIKLEHDIQKQQSANELKIQSKVLLDELQRNIELEKAKKNEHISNLQQDAKMRQEIAARRADGEKRRAEISEAAALQDQASKDAEAREALNAHKLWHFWLNKKLFRETERNSDVEACFQQLKFISGLNEYREIVDTYLSLTTNYTSLLKTIAEEERNLDELQTQFKAFSGRLVEARMMNSGAGQLQDSQEVLFEESKANLKMRERLQGVEEIKLSMHRWCVGLLRLLEQEAEDPSTLTLHDAFRKLLEAVQRLATLSPEQKSALMAAVEAADSKPTTKFLSELRDGSSEYMEKNVRVMPTTLTHRTIAEESEYSSDSEISVVEDLGTTRERMKVHADQISRSQDRRIN